MSHQSKIANMMMFGKKHNFNLYSLSLIFLLEKYWILVDFLTAKYVSYVNVGVGRGIRGVFLVPQKDGSLQKKSFNLRQSPCKTTIPLLQQETIKNVENRYL